MSLFSAAVSFAFVGLLLQSIAVHAQAPLLRGRSSFVDPKGPSVVLGFRLPERKVGIISASKHVAVLSPPFSRPFVVSTADQTTAAHVQQDMLPGPKISDGFQQDAFHLSKYARIKFGPGVRPLPAPVALPDGLAGLRHDYQPHVRIRSNKHPRE